MRRTTRILIFAALAGAAIYAAAAVYGAQASSHNTGFDSNLPEFMKRTDSSLLRIVRHESGGGGFDHIDDYSLGSSDPELYRNIAKVDRAAATSSSSSSSGSQQQQMAFIEIVVSRSETQTIFEAINPLLQTTPAAQQDSEYEIYARNIEVGGRYYTLELLVPK
ncbi:MAG TPA: hypothetical protein VJP79_05855 [Nitrososphaera sp.]|nr:hypothetical protein [Nitrososphaera sp.]